MPLNGNNVGVASADYHIGSDGLRSQLGKGSMPP